jgi:hypothetical protein
MGNAQVRTIFYRSKILAEYAENFARSKNGLMQSVEHQERIQLEEREDTGHDPILAAAELPC